VELNVVITVTSIPLIRPLFGRRKPPLSEPENPTKWETRSLSSAFSVKGLSSRAAALSISSQENIVPRLPEYEMEDTHGITVVREVSVTYQPMNAPFVHAALVGLVEGEIAGSESVRR
jgi:hypothetical protein